MSIRIVLTAANMGPDATERDFDAWATYVVEHIDEALGFEVAELEQHPFRSGPATDTIEGASDEQREAIRGYLGVTGWEAFCAAGGPRGATEPSPAPAAWTSTLATATHDRIAVHAHFARVVCSVCGDVLKDRTGPTSPRRACPGQAPEGTIAPPVMFVAVGRGMPKLPALRLALLQANPAAWALAGALGLPAQPSDPAEWCRAIPVGADPLLTAAQLDADDAVTLYAAVPEGDELAAWKAAQPSQGLNLDGWSALPGGGAVLLSGGVPMRLSDGGKGLDEREVIEEAEELLCLWLAVSVGWGATPEGEAVAVIVQAEEQPTHRITFTPTTGAPEVFLVQLCGMAGGDIGGPDPDARDGVAYTHAEIDAYDPAAWEVMGGVWTHEGQATPGGVPGVVEVVKLGAAPGVAEAMTVSGPGAVGITLGAKR